MNDNIIPESAPSQLEGKTVNNSIALTGPGAASQTAVEAGPSVGPQCLEAGLAACAAAPLQQITSQETSFGPAKCHQKRGADPKNDDLWPRHHALCLMATIQDLRLGGTEAARVATAGQIATVKCSEVVDQAFALCPWLVNADYLNLGSSHAVAKHGIERSVRAWASNRVYYFHYGNEHPAYRIRQNLRLVYTEFYERFVEAVRTGSQISEEDARKFWISVSDRVPFHAPAFRGCPVADPPDEKPGLIGDAGDSLAGSVASGLVLSYEPVISAGTELAEEQFGTIGGNVAQ